MSTLYKRIVDLCENKGIKPGRMCVDLCLSKSLMTKLRDNENKTITAETAAKIANYFNVSVGYLLGTEEIIKKNLLPGIGKQIMEAAGGYDAAIQRLMTIYIQRATAEDMLNGVYPFTSHTLQQVADLFGKPAAFFLTGGPVPEADELRAKIISSLDGLSLDTLEALAAQIDVIRSRNKPQ